MRKITIHLRVTWADRILIGGLLLLSLGSYPLVRLATDEGRTVQVEAGNTRYRTIPLHADQTLIVPGPLGNTTVIVKDGEVFVADSPCRNKICVRTGHISQNGELIVCVPNKVVVRVVGQEEQAYDALTQ